MQLFSDTSFFLCLATILVPAFLLGIREKSLVHYGMAASLFFIAVSMGRDLLSLGYMVAFCLYQLVLTKAYLWIRTKKGRRYGWYYLFLIGTIAPLTLYKVFAEVGNPHHILAFAGISYMTFKTAQIVIETYDGLIRELRTSEFLYLLLFFPTLISGPIDRSRRFEEDLHRIIPKKEYLELAGEGVFKIFQGLVYKKVLATCCYTLMNYFGTGQSPRALLIYMYMYGLYLFFDFAGYSRMAVGVAYFLGIRTPENFNAPFLSKDIKEFWNRWHISLSHWFRDYVFSRITMRLVKSRRFHSKLVIAGIAFIINMGLMGCWHGLSWQYILYGVYHGVLLTGCEVFQKQSKVYKRYKNDRWFQFVEWFLTFHLVLFGFLIFSGRLGGAVASLL